MSEDNYLILNTMKKEFLFKFKSILLIVIAIYNGFVLIKEPSFITVSLIFISFPIATIAYALTYTITTLSIDCSPLLRGHLIEKSIKLEKEAMSLDLDRRLSDKTTMSKIKKVTLINSVKATLSGLCVLAIITIINSPEVFVTYMLNTAIPLSIISGIVSMIAELFLFKNSLEHKCKVLKSLTECN